MQKRGNKQQQATVSNSSATQRSTPIKVGFVHPDLGIGGAERLVVDAALALKSKGCEVTMFTSHHDRTHCFPETLDRLPVVVHGDWLPRHIGRRFHILFAVLRSLWLALAITIVHRGYDVLVVDQISMSIPWLRIFTRSQILFYCHFPDKLLSQRTSWIKRVYRVPFDLMEEFTTGLAHLIAVNSQFTARTFRAEFPHIRSAPFVLYPSINCSMYDEPPPEGTSVLGLSKEDVIIISINRFERKKNIMLAVEAFAKLMAVLPKQDTENLRLVLAGGYDPRLNENVEYLEEIQKRVHALNLSEKVVYATNFSDAQRNYLLSRSSLLLYTPANEHFGIVPVEAMYCKVPVVAANSGGPLESVIDGETGFLRDPVPQAFADAMKEVILDRKKGVAMGEAGRASVNRRFSFRSFTDQLYNVVLSLL